LDSASEFLFGHDVKSLSSDLHFPHFASHGTIQCTAADQFAIAFSKSQDVIAQRTRIGWTWPLFEIFKEKTAEPMKVVNAFL
jgi:hypothetical protein